MERRQLAGDGVLCLPRLMVYRGGMRLPNALQKLADRPATLGSRTARAGIWSVVELGLGQFLRLAGNLIMTRLLLPEAFGLMAMVTTLQVGLTLVTDLGIHRSVVQSSEGETPRFLRICWVLQAVRGAVIAGIVLLAAGLLWLFAPALTTPGTVYADPRLPGLIALSSLALVMKGVESPNQFLAERHMAMGRVALVNLASQVAGLVGMVVLGLLSPTVWALLSGMLLGGVCRLALTHLAFAGPRMAIEWDPRIADDLWNFGKWLMGSSALTFVAGYADRLILGALLDVESFGFYTIALMWVQAASQLVGKLTGSVGFSVLSQVQRERPEQTARIFRRFATVIDGVCLAGFLALLLGGPLLIDLLYPEIYATSAAFMALLGVSILAGRFDSLSMLVLSQGHSRTMMAVSALRAAAICVSLPVCFALFGIGGALLATALSSLAAAPLLIARVSPVLGGRVRRDVAWVAAIIGVAVMLYLFQAP
jgi:O-antigen/teichoic acid export membrane protein